MIKFTDLNNGHKKIQNNLRKKIEKIFLSKKFILGPEAIKLENSLSKYIKSKCIAVSSGTDAILLALMAIQVKAGDEIITTPFTWASSVEMIKLLGAKPVYIDIDPRNFNLNANLVKSKITKKTKAILTVNIFGQCCDYDLIKKSLKGKKIFIIEDAAQSFGAKYKNRKSGSLGDISCTSFFPSKPLGCYGDGGACFTNNKNLYDKIKILRNHGQLSKNNHKIVGLNARIDEIQAGVLNEKLKIFKNEIVLRNKIAKSYEALLRNKKDILYLPKIEKFNYSVFAQYSILVKNRDFIVKKFKEKKIPFAIFYPQPLYKQMAFRDKRYKLENVEEITKNIISLPFHPYLSSKHQNIISNCFN